MDLQTFMTSVGELTLFPPHVIAYAGGVAPDMDDAGRGKLLKELQAIHADIKRLEDKQIAEYDKALGELKAIKRTEMPAIRKAVEKDEHAANLDAATKNFDK